MNEHEKKQVSACTDYLEEEITRILERESSADAVLKKVTLKLGDLMMTYKIKHQVPSHHDIFACAAMMAAIGVACMPPNMLEPHHKHSHQEHDSIRGLLA